jgi:hypothetical protein
MDGRDHPDKIDAWMRTVSIRGFVMRLFNSTLLRLLLFTLGQWLALASRISPSIRSQVTRSLTFEISTDDGVVRQWHFNAPQRRITTRGRRPRPSTNALRFPSSGAALRVLLSPHCARLIAEGMQHSTTRVEGALFAVYWFLGLTRKFIAIGFENGPRGPLPDPYIRHDPRSNGSEQIIIEPPIDHLDPTWTSAWQQRAKLLGVRATTGEPMSKV